MDSWLCTCCNVWHELGSFKKLKQQLVEGKRFAAWRLQKPLLLLLLQQPVLTFLLCLPCKLGWSWRCRVLCIPRTSSDTRWAHRDHERCRGALASFISAVKKLLVETWLLLLSFQQQDGLALETLCLEMSFRSEVFLTQNQGVLWHCQGVKQWKARALSAWAEPRRLWAGGMSLGLTTWTLLHLCESVAVMCREQNMGSEQRLHRSYHERNPSSTGRAERCWPPEEGRVSH